ncbi:hypothetical protein GCM10027074_40760 [Streptomyces deserti]
MNGLRIDHLIAQAPPEAWQRLSAGPGAEGQRLYDWAAARLPAVDESDVDEPTRQRWMPAHRSISKPDEIAYHLACAPLDATVAGLVRVAGCRWKIEECFQSAKNECGLGQYEVRRYVGWYRHITLAMLAHAFLAVMAVQEREKGVSRPTHPTSRTSHQPEIRRLLAAQPRRHPAHRDHAVNWSRWRRRHQARARRCHLHAARAHVGGTVDPRPSPACPTPLHSPPPGR